MEIKGSGVLLTGASTGIGAATADALAAKGARLVLVARRKQLLDEVAARALELGAAEAHVVTADLADLDAVDALAAQAEELLGGVDILVNNAGAAKRKHLTRTTWEDIVSTMHLNYLSPVRLTLALLPAMVARGSGFIMNVGSLAGRIGAPIEAAYAASKFAITGFSESAFVDLASSGIKVAVMQPGTIDTPLWETAAGDDKPLYDGPLFPAADVAAGIVEQLEGGSFELFVQRDLAPVIAFKATDIDTFLAGSVAFANMDR
jgi:short-subunit dehydrogenase